MTIQQVLSSLQLPVTYSHFKDGGAQPPFLAYLGSGQNVFSADDTYYHRTNAYQVEYYFTVKDEDQETTIEDAFLDNGFHYSKSEDVFIESEGLFVIYYTVN